MSTHRLIAEDFISEVRKYPALWDINCDDYRYPTRRQRAWSAIARTFVDQFDELPNGEKLSIYKKLQDKWKNIRDSYVKSVKSNTKKSYMYAPHLHFLTEIYKPCQSEGEDHNIEDTKIKLIKKEKRSYDESNDDWQSDGDDSNVEYKRRKADDIEFVDTFPEVASALYTEEDEDRSFFNSLLPAVRQFSMDQKLEFRSEVLGIIKKIRADVS